MAESCNPTRREIIGYFDRNNTNSENAKAIINHLRTKYGLHENTEETLTSDIKNLEWNWRAKWQKHGRNKNRFELHEKDWLDGSALKMEKFIQTYSVNSN